MAGVLQDELHRTRGRDMDQKLIYDMKQRLIRLRRVAAIAHDRAVVELVTQTADEIEADLRGIESDSLTATAELANSR